MPFTIPSITEEDLRIASFLNKAFYEAGRNIREHGHFHSDHEAYGVLKEEVEEYWAEVKKGPSQEQAVLMYNELVQIAAVAAAAACNLLYER